MNSLELMLDLRSYHPDSCSHQHDYHQLVLPLAGCLEMEIDRDDGEVSAQQAAIIPAGTQHCFASQGDNCFIVADVPVALAPELARLPPFINLDEGLSHYLLFLRHELQHELRQGKANRHHQRQMLLLLVQLLTERFGETLRIDRRLETARHYLDGRLDQSVTLAEVALVAHLSPRQLTALFRRYFDMSPQHYLLEQRMQLAWRLLTETGMSVQQIAERCGYSNLSAFSSRFSSHFGCSPRQRRSHSAGSTNN